MAELMEANDHIDHQFTACIFGGWDTFDPHRARDEASMHIVQNVYETPWRSTMIPTGKAFEPMLCEAPMVEDTATGGCKLCLALRPDITFHSGRQCTAEDVAFSLARALLLADVRAPLSQVCAYIWEAPGSNQPREKILNVQSLADAVSVAGDTITLCLRRRFTPAVDLVGAFGFVMSRQWAAERGDWDGKWETATQLLDSGAHERLRTAADGSGAYALQEVERDRVGLRRHGAFRGEKPYFERVVIERVDSPEARAELVKAGEVDFAVCSRSALGNLASDDPVKIHDGLPELNVNPFAAFNLEIEADQNSYLGSGRLDGDGIPSGFFADWRVRRAIACAFDYGAFLEQGLRGIGERAIGPIPRRLMPEAEVSAVYGVLPEHDVDIARALWASAWNGECARLGCRLAILTHSDNPERTVAAEIMAAGMRELGRNVVVDVIPLEWTSYLRAIHERRAPVFWIGYQADYLDAHSFAGPLLHSQGSIATAQSLRSAALDAMIEQAVETESDDAKSNAYQAINRCALLDTWQVYTFERQRFVVLNESIDGLQFDPLQYSVFKYADLRRREAGASS